MAGATMKRNMQSLRVAICLLILSATNIAAQNSPQQTQADKERRAAERTWEQMVKVKGGRERLHAITNMLLTSGDKPKNMGVKFYVYPVKIWRWSQAPPSPDLIWVDMTNLDRNISLVANSNDKSPSAVEMTDWRRQAIRREILEEACAYLLETKWLQPEPIRETRQRVGGKLMDVIETRIRDAESGREGRMDFVVEPESLLVSRVIRYYEGKPVSFYCYDDYVAVDGIRMPRRTGNTNYRFWNEKCRYPYPLHTRFNVDYNPQLFERPPSAEAGAEAWRARTQ
jgi:hypothetical protein